MDSLDLDILSEDEKQFLEKTLNKFHNSDLIKKMQILSLIIENLNSNTWIEYQIYQYENYLNNDIIIQKIKDEDPELLQEILGNSLGNMGLISRYDGDFISSLDYYWKSVKNRIRKDSLDYKGIESSLRGCGVALESLGHYQKAILFKSKGLKFAELSSDTFSIAKSKHGLAVLYSLAGDYEEAIKFDNDAVNIFKSLNDSLYVGACLTSLAFYLSKVKRYDESIKNNLLAIKYLSEKDERAKFLMSSYIGLSSSYLVSNNMTEAVKSLKKAEDVKERNGIKDAFLISKLHSNFASYFIKVNKVDSAKIYSDLLKEEVELSNNIEVLKDYYHSRYRIFEIKGDYKLSLKYYKNLISVIDSMESLNNKKTIIRQQTQHEFEKEQIRMENEAKEKARVEAEELKRRNNMEYSLIFLGILALFGLVMMLGFIKVSPNIAEGLIFFAFLIFFEFLLVFTEPYLEQYTQGEPVYALLANSALALIIFPLHAVLERLLKKRIVK